MRHRWRRAGGQVVVIFGVGLLVILLTVGLVVDGGTAFLERRDAQNDADIATLAGTKIVADAYTDPTRIDRSRGEVFTAISGSMTVNGCVGGGPTPCTWRAWFVGPGATDVGAVVAGDTAGIRGSGILGVHVDVSRRPRTYFLGLIGQSSWKVDSTATALATKPEKAPAGQVLPIGLKEPLVPFQTGQVYDVTAGKTTPGGFVWLSWSASRSLGVLKASVCSPNNQAFSIPGTINSGPMVADPTSIPCFGDWISSKSTVLIPIFRDPLTDKMLMSYHVDRLAAFVIVSVGTPTASDIRARFVGTYAYPSTPNAGDQPPSDLDSLYYVGLVH
jgi:hypothetical protein